MKICFHTNLHTYTQSLSHTLTQHATGAPQLGGNTMSQTHTNKHTHTHNPSCNARTIGLGRTCTSTLSAFAACAAPAPVHTQTHNLSPAHELMNNQLVSGAFGSETSVLPHHFVLEYEEQDSYYNATPRLSPSSTGAAGPPDDVGCNVVNGDEGDVEGTQETTSRATPRGCAPLCRCRASWLPAAARRSMAAAQQAPPGLAGELPRAPV
jgi:hypothetical protein